MLSFFYLKPLQKTPVDPRQPWFEPSPIGKNTLAKYVQCMCKEAGISEKKTNHSLRATGTSAMFSAAVPEKLIKGITGHKSTEALQVYERPTVQQQQAVSRVLTGRGNSTSYLPRAVYARAGLSNWFCPSLSSLSVIKKIEKTV